MRKSKSSRFLKAAILAGAALFSQGCATMGSRVDRSPENGREGVFYLENVPPVVQSSYQCGSAALVSVLRYWGVPANVDSVSRDLFKPGSMGVLDFTMAGYARERGFWTRIPEVSDSEKGLAQLKDCILQKTPPIVMLKSGILWVPTYHFVVLKGFDEKARIFYANTGEDSTQAIAYSGLAARWRQAGCWYLVLCPAEKVEGPLSNADALDLALFCERSGKRDLAEKWYRSVLAEDPHNTAARFDLANVYRESGRLKEAETIYIGLAGNKEVAEMAVNNLAWLYLSEERPADAIHVIRGAFRARPPGRSDILDTLGVSYCRLKQYSRARRYLIEAIRKAPADRLAERDLIHQHLSACRLAAGQR